MAGLSYKPLSYTELSTFQLLCIKDVYQLIDTICADKYADWNIIDFEKAVVSNKYPNSYDEQSVRTAIESSLLRLDSEKPRKRYLEQGKHYAYELFLYLPEQFRFDEQPYKLFWAYMAREFSNNELPIEKKQFRERYIAVLKQFNMRLYSNRTLYVKRFSVKTRYGEQMELEERDIRNAFSTLEGRNQAYTRKYECIGETAYLDRAVEKLGEFTQRIYPDYQIRKDLNVHELCFAIDSACTELARNDILLLWGVFTGKPITLAACGSKRGVSPSCIRQRQEMVVRNTGHGSRRIIMEPKSDDE